jgi:riboflavin synthase alpha subunit
MKLGDRLDGHIVQGHVTGTCTPQNKLDGSLLPLNDDETLNNITMVLSL